MIITIDGPAGSGKSTVARALARRLGLRYLDTGAMYRAVALAGVRHNVDFNRPDELADVAERIELRVDGSRILLDGEDVTDAVRSAEITALTRHAADNPSIRRQLIALQRRIAAHTDVVTEGRDQGSLAFPRADHKIYLTATPEERARRRMADFDAQGESHEFDSVLADIVRRDEEDSTRELGRLVRPTDAIEVVTDGLSIEEVVDRIDRIVRANR